MHQPQRRKLGHWLLAVILSSGQPLHDPHAWPAHRVYSINGNRAFDAYEWTIEKDGTLSGVDLRSKWTTPNAEVPVIRASCAGWGHAVHYQTDPASPLPQPLLHNEQGTVILAGHPSLHHGPTMTAPRPTYRADLQRKELHTHARPTTMTQLARAAGLQGVQRRLERLQHADAEVYNAVQSRRLWTDPGLTAYQHIFQYRLCLGALNTRDNEGRAMRCPHPTCNNDDDALSMAHVVWRCPGAQRTWCAIWTQWTGRELHQHENAPVDQCLGAVQPQLARNWTQILFQLFADHETIATATTVAWTVIRAVLPHRLWLIRNEAAFQTGAGQHPRAIAERSWYTAREQLHSIAATDSTDPTTRDRGLCLKKLLQLLDEPRPATNPEPTHVRLYYDGGSRGNPGKSGSGSVIIKKDPATQTWSIVWWDFHSLLGDHTNNYAEHIGLARGLKECARLYSHLHQHVQVIGDSLLVTRQFQGQARTSTGLFHQPVHSSRTALRAIASTDFHHTLRSGNTMADWLANHAMDTVTTASSTTTNDPDVQRNLEERLNHDTSHALTDLSPTSRHLPNIQHQLRRLTATIAKRTTRPPATATGKRAKQLRATT